MDFTKCYKIFQSPESVHGACISGELVRNLSFVVPSPPRSGGPAPEWGSHRRRSGVTWEVV